MSTEPIESQTMKPARRTSGLVEEWVTLKPTSYEAVMGMREYVHDCLLSQLVTLLDMGISAWWVGDLEGSRL